MARHLWSQPTSCASPPHLANTDWDKIGESKMGIWGFGMKIVQKKGQIDGHCIRQNMAIMVNWEWAVGESSCPSFFVETSSILAITN